MICAEKRYNKIKNKKKKKKKKKKIILTNLIWENC